MGRIGPLSLGLLDIQTESAPVANAEATNFSVVRIKSDVLRRSNVGVIVTNRRPSLTGGGSNLVYGADANMLFYENVQINGFYAHSSTTETGGDAKSYRAQAQYDSDRYGIQGEVLKVGDAFNPEVGFLLRDDFRRTFASARFSPRPTSSRYVRKLTWEASFDRFVNGANVLETQKEMGSFGVEFNTSDMLTLAFSRKLEFLTEPFEVRVFDSGPKSELVPVDTPLGRVGTLVCWDGFHQTLVEHYDALSVDILLQPSYNQKLWNGPCSYDAPGTEGENRLRTTCVSMIQGRENIQYGIEAFMVGAVFEDMLAEGLSYVAQNTGRVGASWEEGVIAMAEKPDAEEIVVATVEVDGRR
ncbi:MAG: hypothetical protein IH921_12080 [Gemmatimonadetes bacterium]|nr:hypothetical protein [Gemmatimonadota bacterium]